MIIFVGAISVLEIDWRKRCQSTISLRYPMDAQSEPSQTCWSDLGPPMGLGHLTGGG